MEQYSVPQFIEQESRITTFLTIRQFIYLLAAGVLLIFLYNILPFTIFVIVAVIIGGGAIGLSFIRLNGEPLLTLVLNSIGFSGHSRNYTWKKKESLYPFRTVQRAPLKKVEDDKRLGIGQKSSLKDLRTKIELKTK